MRVFHIIIYDFIYITKKRDWFSNKFIKKKAAIFVLLFREDHWIWLINKQQEERNIFEVKSYEVDSLFSHSEQQKWCQLFYQDV